ncbi:rhomboid family intramembrane serine protease [Dinoroseobacter sp. PD6]|uniref:rhomboid family intramembrane serine protease n=1 Tax=Dinoroseobacter sp. PD6 TaxID=3028384 RepID=UPI00237A55EC|nr:rhomboid family intramembrane serine protease [Dinoroseobacter sp. PD6]MDD9718163.1 rhomboid family intramembrane serine protease [Dinoroseobacter sp. PD6]
MKDLNPISRAPGPEENANSPAQVSMIAPLVIIGFCILVEGILQLANLGMIDHPRLRAEVVEYLGFWPGLLGTWRPNYAGQPYAMFFTYGFLHGGLLHLVLNMVTLYSLSRAVIDRVGSGKYLLLYAATIIGGAIGYWLLTSSLRPMVGASGALFGLAGAIVAWDYLDRFLLSEGLWPVLRTVLFLVGLNIALWWAMGGQLAWETHLGGFVTGWVMAMLLDPRGRPMDDPPPTDQ